MIHVYKVILELGIVSNFPVPIIIISIIIFNHLPKLMLSNADPSITCAFKLMFLHYQ